MQNKSITRRSFIQKSGLATSSVLLGAASVKHSWARNNSPNDTLGIGVIGTGGRGNSHLRMLNQLKEAGENIEILAVCDIYRSRLDAAASAYKAKAYDDHRELLQNKNIDIVCIATPDHIHGYQAIDAIEAGKGVYCEKPITHWRQFELTRKLLKTVQEKKGIFQLGTQAMSDSVWHQMKQLVKEGLIGQPLDGETGFFRIGDWGEREMKIDDPDAIAGKDLNWEAFLGDSPKREFSVDRFFRWRLFEDYAGGPVTDLYPHSLTQVIDILGVDMPESVVALGGIHRYDYELRDVPDTFNLIAQYPEKVTISVLGTQANDFNSTVLRGAGQRCPVIRGWEGSLTIHKNNKDIIYTPIREKGAKAPQTIPIENGENNINHWKNLLECYRTGNTNTWSPMELAYRTQTVLQMAMMANKSQKVLHYDKEKMEIV